MKPTRRWVIAAGLAAGVAVFVAFALSVTSAGSRLTALGLVAAIVAVSAAVMGGQIASEAGERDPVTGLHVRERILERAARRSDPDQPGALLHIDVDRFAAVNEVLGRANGDRLLAAIAVRIHGGAGPRDVIVRLGSDEFAMLLREATIEEAMVVAETIRTSVENLALDDADPEGRHADVAVSIGVTPLDRSVGMGEMQNRAHAACYRAKVLGRNRVELYRPGLADESQRTSDSRWAVRLKAAMRADRLRLYLQPIVDIADGVVVQHEVLVRLEEDDGSIVNAGAFIPSAERSGLILEIDRRVISAAIRHCIEHPSPAGCAINLSGLSLHEGETSDFILSEIATSGVDPSKLTFEITETAAMANLDTARRIMEELRSAGCHIALDDFGSGFSSFAYLRSLPVDMVKIDGAFTRHLSTDEMNRSIVRSINDLAHDLGLLTVAESVEDPTVLEALRALGVDRAQGFHFGEPQAAERTARDDSAARPDQPSRGSQARGEIRLPPRKPEEILGFLDFLDRLEHQVRGLRERSALPDDTLERPERFDAAVTRLRTLIHRQAVEADRSGAGVVEVRLPVTPDLIALTEWASTRIDVLTSITEAGLVQRAWERPLKIMIEIYNATYSQLGGVGP